MLVHAQRENLKFGILNININQFSDTNNDFGHDICDNLLIQMAQRIKDIVGVAGLVGRIEGDVFMVILKQDDNFENIVKKITNAVNRQYVIDTNLIKIKVRIGIAVFPEDGKDIGDLMEKAIY